MKRIVTMQDISCIGKCSLTVVLPVISCMGVETAVLPTAVLSTEALIDGFTYHDLTSENIPIIEHWKSSGFTFDAVYTGYLGTTGLVDIARRLFHEFGSGKLKIVDPCLGDNGILYPGFTQEYVDAVRGLCSEADILCPNLTEACFLLNIPFHPSCTREETREILHKLSALGAEKTVLTGISFAEGTIGTCTYDRRTDTYAEYFTEEEPEYFQGTGDLWAGTLCGGLVSGFSFEDSAALACDFVKESIRLTLAEEGHNTYGVNFEQAVPYLLKRLSQMK